MISGLVGSSAPRIAVAAASSSAAAVAVTARRGHRAPRATATAASIGMSSCRSRARAPRASARSAASKSPRSAASDAASASTSARPWPCCGSGEPLPREPLARVGQLGRGAVEVAGEPLDPAPAWPGRTRGRRCRGRAGRARAAPARARPRGRRARSRMSAIRRSIIPASVLRAERSHRLARLFEHLLRRLQLAPAASAGRTPGRAPSPSAPASPSAVEAARAPRPGARAMASRSPSFSARPAREQAHRRAHPRVGVLERRRLVRRSPVRVAREQLQHDLGDGHSGRSRSSSAATRSSSSAISACALFHVGASLEPGERQHALGDRAVVGVGLAGDGERELQSTSSPPAGCPDSSQNQSSVTASLSAARASPRVAEVAQRRR